MLLEVEGYREPRLALGKQVTEARVRLLRGAEAGVLTHGPQAAPVAGWIDAPCEGILAREAQRMVRVPPRQIFGPVEFLQFQARRGLELLDGFSFVPGIHVGRTRRLAKGRSLVALSCSPGPWVLESYLTLRAFRKE